MKALYVGQIEEGENRDKFKHLMDSLSEAYGKYKGKKGDGDTCIIYNYYDTTKEVTENNANEHIFEGIEPAEWAKLWREDDSNKESCREIINYVLDLSEFGKYLKDKQKDLESEHDICCCVTYYHNRTGSISFHQDSLGAELFVSLIYRDPVYGPELKLKQKSQFKKRIDDIRHMMPSCFITELEGLHENVQNKNNHLVIVDKEEKELNPNMIEWPGRLEKAGGIVGWVDELFIHTTPYMHRRKANGAFLLKVLDYIKDKNLVISLDKEQLIRAVDKLKEIVVEKAKENHYIITGELWVKEQDEASKKVLDKLSELLGILDATIKKYKVEKEEEIEGAEVELNKWSLELGITLEDILQGTDSTLGGSLHQLYNGSNSYASTEQVNRRLSMELEKNSSLIGAEETKQRSFLRVWVIALPKQKSL
jgi:hypothetical protein